MIIKNNSLVTKSWAGIEIPAGGTYTIQEVDRARLLSAPLFLADLSSNVAIVNDGTADLTASVGLLALKLQAIEARFSNSSNGFLSNNIQSAIEEARSGASGKILSFCVTRQGSASNSFLYQADSGITTDTSPLIMPANATIVGLTAISDSGNRNYDVRLNISKFNSGTTIDRTLIYQVRGTRSFVRSNYTPDSSYNLDAGDKISVFCQTQGAAPSDLVVHIFYQLTSGSNVSRNENFTSNFTITIGPITITIG